MTNQIAIALATVIVAALVADFGLNDGQASLFLARKFVELVEYLSFWR